MSQNGNGHYVGGAPLTKPEAARWMESLRGELLQSLGQSNRTHVLTAWRMMAWEDLVMKRRFGLVRVLALALLRPSALMARVTEMQNTIMREQEQEAHQELLAAAAAAPKLQVVK